MSVMVHNVPLTGCCGRPRGDCRCGLGPTPAEMAAWLRGQAAPAAAPAVANAAPPGPLPVLDIEGARRRYDPAVLRREPNEERPVHAGPGLPTPRPACPPVTNAALPVLDVEAERRSYDPAVLNRKADADEQTAVLLPPELGLRPPRLWW